MRGRFESCYLAHVNPTARRSSRVASPAQFSQPRHHMETPTALNRGREKGAGIVELVVVATIISIISAFSLIQIRYSRSALRVQNSVRQLASYMEKARVDAVRRHGTSTVVFSDTRTYAVT